MKLSWAIAGPPVRGRSCGDCQLCCTLLPVRSLGKGANTRCQHQCSRGCAIYPDRPYDCRTFSCRWLFDETTFGVRRPDKIGAVIDASLDTILADGQPCEVIQVWIDPKRPDAHRDPTLREWIAWAAREYRLPTLIRFNEKDGFVLFAPALTETGDWMEISGSKVMSEDESATLRRESLQRWNITMED